MKIEIIVDFSQDVKDLLGALLGKVKPGQIDRPAIVDTVIENPEVKAAVKKAAAPKTAAPAPKMEVVKPDTTSAEDDFSDILGSDGGADDLLNQLAEGGEAEPKATTPAPAPKKAAAKKTAVEPSEPLYTLDRVKEKVKELIQAGKSVIVQDLIKKHNAVGVSSLDPLHYNSFMEGLNAIK